MTERTRGIAKIGSLNFTTLTFRGTRVLPWARYVAVFFTTETNVINVYIGLYRYTAVSRIKSLEGGRIDHGGCNQEMIYFIGVLQV